MTNETIEGLKRLSWLPDREDGLNGNLIAGQEYYDVYFTGGDITGVNISGLTAPLPIADGGTGQATAIAALNALLPTQAGNTGKSLKTDGANTSWGTDTDTGITQLTGDVTAGPGSGSQVATLATVNSNIGSFGSSTSIPTITVTAKGLVTAASGNAVIAPAGTLTGATLAANILSSSLTSIGTLTNLNVTNPITGSVTGNAGTVTTNANLTGAITSVGNAASLGSFSSANLATALTDETGSGGNVFANTPTLITPILGAAVATSINFGGTSLANYEEGTYTVTMTAVGGGTITLDSTRDAGSYVRIGNSVDVGGYVTVASVSGPTGELRISLPFTAADLLDTSGTRSVPVVLDGTISAGAGPVPARVAENTAYVRCYTFSATALGSSLAQQIQAGTEIYFSATYRV